MELYSNERVIRIGLIEQTQTPPARKSYLCIKSFMSIVFKYVIFTDTTMISKHCTPRYNTESSKPKVAEEISSSKMWFERHGNPTTVISKLFVLVHDVAHVHSRRYNWRSSKITGRFGTDLLQIPSNAESRRHYTLLFYSETLLSSGERVFLSERL